MSYNQLVAKKAGSDVIPRPPFRALSFKSSFNLWGEHVVDSSYPGHSTLCNCNDEIMNESFSFWSSQMTVDISECWYYNFSVQSTEFIVYWLFPVSSSQVLWRKPRTKQISALHFQPWRLVGEAHIHRNRIKEYIHIRCCGRMESGLGRWVNWGKWGE